MTFHNTGGHAPPYAVEPPCPAPFPILAEAVLGYSALSREMRAAASADMCPSAREAMMLRRLADMMDETMRAWSRGFETVRPHGLVVSAHLVRGRA